MKRIFLILCVITLKVNFISCASFQNWGKRVNVTIGPGLAVNDTNASNYDITYLSDSITIMDGFGHYYTTSWEISPKEDSIIPPIYFGLSLPFYWKDFNNSDIEIGIITKLFSPYIGIGPYFEGAYKKFSLNISLGFSLSVEDNFEVITNSASKAYSNDPGMYLNGSFRNPSTFKADVKFDEKIVPGFYSSLGIKFHFLNWMFVESGYTFFGKTGKSINGITVDTTYTAEKKYNFNVDFFYPNNHIFYIGIGFGI